MLSTWVIAATLLALGSADSAPETGRSTPDAGLPDERTLCIEHDVEAEALSVFRQGGEEPLLRQHARAGARPYLHPIVAPDGKGVLTEYRPEHHPHQTGLYWGLKEVNGRDYFMGWQADHWRRVSASAVEQCGEQVRWQTVYDLLDEHGVPLLTETQNWTMRDRDGRILLDLQWKGEARREIVVGQFYVGGLFLRMPWHEGIRGAVVNAVGQRDGEAEGQRAIWADVGLEIEGREDYGHVAILDHPDNAAFPTAWRVDNEMGVGPSRQITNAWSLGPGETDVARYRIVVYTGELDAEALHRIWTEFAVDG